MRTQRTTRPAFTLMELLVVLVILALVAALVIPRISGVEGQATSATNANILSAVNRAVQQFEAQYGKLPDTWDYVVDETDAPYKLHANLLADPTSGQPVVTTMALTTQQANSLNAAGMVGGHHQSSTHTGMPHESIGGWAAIAQGRTVLTLVKPATFGGHYHDWADRAFGINQFNAKGFASEYVVFGLAGPTSLRGNTILESPVIQGANPQDNYARVLCVFRVPATDGSQTDFPAQYVGCFGPDGTTINDNLKKYENSNVPLRE